MNTVTTTLKFLSLTSIAVLVSACATPIESTIDSASEVDISHFKTYAWISQQPYTSENASRAELVNPLNYRRIRAGIDAELQHKGYVQTNVDEADLVLGVTLGTRDRVRVQQYYSDLGYQYYGFNRFNRFGRFGRFSRFRSGLGPYTTTTSVRTITEGSVAIDIFDNQSRQAIWHGHASKSLTRDAMGRKLIAEAIDALIGPIPEHEAVAASVQMDAVENSVVM